jgi:hypothetical protein
MKQGASWARGWIFPAAVAAALGFGAVQAAASPADSPSPATCGGVDCKTYCASRGGEAVGCFNNTCICRIWV